MVSEIRESNLNENFCNYTRQYVIKDMLFKSTEIDILLERIIKYIPSKFYKMDTELQVYLNEFIHISNCGCQVSYKPIKLNSLLNILKDTALCPNINSCKTVTTYFQKILEGFSFESLFYLVAPYLYLELLLEKYHENEDPIFISNLNLWLCEAVFYDQEIYNGGNFRPNKDLMQIPDEMLRKINIIYEKTCQLVMKVSSNKMLNKTGDIGACHIRGNMSDDFSIVNILHRNIKYIPVEIHQLVPYIAKSVKLKKPLYLTYRQYENLVAFCETYTSANEISPLINFKSLKQIDYIDILFSSNNNETYHDLSEVVLASELLL